jgi:uracil-DNA glycosylase
MASVREVFASITHCPNIALALMESSHPCSAIVRSQHVPENEFQLPEPWRGQIDKARILFVGSNPSIGDDRYALRSSPDEQVWESQHLAFGGGSRPYVLDGIKTTKPDGSPLKLVRYWSSIRARARELLPDALPGEDYAVTEIVHCKSVGEIGVHEAALTCYNLHGSNVFSVSPAKVVVVLGKFARGALLGAGADLPSTPLDMDLGGRTRNVLFLPHPNARGGEKSLEAHCGHPALDAVRRLLVTT